MKRLSVAVWWIALYLAAGACLLVLLTGAVLVVQVVASGPWGVACLLGAALAAVGCLWLSARRGRDDALRRLWQARIREQELMEQRNTARREVEAYRNASDEWFKRLFDNEEI